MTGVPNHPWRGPRERDGLAEPGEFPERADRPRADVSRRELLQLLGASAALAGAAGCSRGPQGKIVPYVRQPPEVTPAVASRYATATSVDGYAVGLVVESHEGRPTKAEGNEHHPANRGALGPIHQACVLDLYDPMRSRAVTYDRELSTWPAFAAAVLRPPRDGAATHLLLEPTSSPHVVDWVRRVRARGNVVVHFDAPLSPRNGWAASQASFGRTLEPRLDFSLADVVLALDSDFLGSTSTPPAWVNDWGKLRRPRGPDRTMSRLYAVEGRLSVTGMAADHRLRVPARLVADIASAVLYEILRSDTVAPIEDVARAIASRNPREHAPWARAVATDLLSHRGACLVVAGDAQPPEVHVLVHAMNELLGNVGRTVAYGPSPVFEAGEASHGLMGLLRALDAGEIGTLLIVGGNPAYTAPADLRLADRWQSVATTAFVGARWNETAKRCRWFGPEAHFLESWSDARAFDGTPAIVQPLIGPWIDGRTVSQLLAGLLGETDVESHELVQRYWRTRVDGGSFDAFWDNALTRGVVPGEALPPVSPPLDWNAVARAAAMPSFDSGGLEIVYFADCKVHDGRFADSACLQELADPVTKLTWDNAALVSPATATKRQLVSEDVVELEVRGRRVRAPVLVCPAMADDVVAIAIGYGQTIPDHLSYGVGANAYALRDSHALWADDVALRKVDGQWPLALTQEHWSMEGRPIVLRRTVDEARRDPAFAKPLNERVRSLYGIKPAAPRQWGMTVDLNACTGCSACVVACMTENNVPVVGKGGVRLSREMHWLRIDRYFIGEPEEASAVVQPMLCQHCEKAPCEYVCPVNATVHSDDGLNEMVYNRCVGTRFCSNNCPYKVRRFNFFNYTKNKPETEQLAMNPDVTVRDRGVMEKCTYCVQRIREAEIRARREQRPLGDGEIKTACQQTCPTSAIVFGDIADPTSRVSHERRSDRLYAVLNDLGTVPRTRYLARIVNPNPDMP